MSHKDHGLGRIAAPDAEDARYPMRATLRTRAIRPPKKSWAFRGSPFDQGSTGTCVAHACVHFLRCAPIQSTKLKFTPYDLYRELVLIDEWAENDGEAQAPDSGLQYGSSVRAGVKALEARGHIAQYVWAQNLATAVDFVTEHGPIIAGTSWYDGMFQVTRDGYARIKPNDTVAGGHAYLIRAVDTRKARARIVNSWKTWGADSEAWIDFADLERLIHEDGEICGPTEKKLIKKPKPVAAADPKSMA